MCNTAIIILTKLVNGYGFPKLANTYTQNTSNSLTHFTQATLKYWKYWAISLMAEKWK